jgi:hypothetical protein
MKIHLPASHLSRPARSGSAVIVILAMLGIMALLVASNTRTVNWLRAEVRLVDQRQTARLAASATNDVTHPLVNPAPAP